MTYKGLFILLLTLLVTAAGANTDPNFSFSATQSQSRPEEIIIKAVVSTGHMLYRNQLFFEASVGKLNISWAESTNKKDPFGDGTVDVYPEGTHTFSLLVLNEDQLKEMTLTIKYQGCSALTCYMPTKKQFDFSFDPPLASRTHQKPITLSAAPQTLATQTAPVKIEMSQITVDFSAALKNQGIYWVLLLSLLGGLLVSLTPCVYPMIPITLSIIGSRNENVSFYKGLGLSATYIAGLSLTYALLGLAAATFGAQIRSFTQGSLFQGLVSIIFFLLALSMFDLILIQVPAGLRDRLNNIKKTGSGGIFVMGMVSGLMASPCVAAPLAGILAFIATTGNQLLGFLMLLLFAWGMSLPLLLIGAFSGSLNAVPKAGEWMNKVKEFYGFLLLAAALYFAQPLIGIAWVELGIAALLASFAAFLGLFSDIPTDAGLRPRVFKSFGAVALAVACAFAISAAAQWGCLCLPRSESLKQIEKAETFWQHNLQKAMAEAKTSNRPLFIDFRADWCSVCKNLELNVFPQPEIRSLLQKMVPVKIDATSPDDATNEILKQYGIIGLPTLLILRSDGQEMQNLRTVGYISSEQLAKKLRSAL